MDKKEIIKKVLRALVSAFNHYLPDNMAKTQMFDNWMVGIEEKELPYMDKACESCIKYEEVMPKVAVFKKIIKVIMQTDQFKEYKSPEKEMVKQVEPIDMQKMNPRLRKLLLDNGMVNESGWLAEKNK